MGYPTIDWPTVLALVFGFINMLFAGFLLLETKKLREAETEPEISIYLQRNQEIASVYDIVVKNIGKGPAYNLSFDFDKNAEIIKVQQFRKLPEIGFFQGVEYLAPNQEYKSIFGAQELLQEPPLTPLRIDVQFSNHGRKKRSRSFHLDPSEYWGTIDYDPKTIDRLSKDIHKISVAVEQISKHLKRPLDV